MAKLEGNGAVTRAVEAFEAKLAGLTQEEFRGQRETLLRESQELLASVNVYNGFNLSDGSSKRMKARLFAAWGRLDD